MFIAQWSKQNENLNKGIKLELNKCKRELFQTKDVVNQIKNERKQYTQLIIVDGFN